MKETLKQNDPVAYNEWKSKHICKLNYKGTWSQSEQKNWECSEEKNKLRYTELYGDGDNKCFYTVRDTYTGIHVKKLESVGHVQKRVRCRLRNLKKRENGHGGKGKLTNNIIDRLQNYYGIAIRENKSNLNAMQSAKRATLFHVASNKYNNYHDTYYPKGSNSWRKFRRDYADGTSTYKPGPGLPLQVIFKLKPIFQELSNEDLLKKWLHGLTQNGI